MSVSQFHNQAHDQSSRVQDEMPLHHVSQQKKSQGMGQDLEEIFSAIEKNFDNTFNSNNEVQQLATQQPSRQVILTGRRKTKPIYSPPSRSFQFPRKQSPTISSPHNQNYNQVNTTNSPSLSQHGNHLINPNDSHNESSSSSPYQKIANTLNTSQHQLSYKTPSNLNPNYNMHSPLKDSNNQADQFSYQNSLIKKENQNFLTYQSPESNYKDLQEKIESALRKSNLSKTLGSHSRLTKSNFTTKSFNVFNQMLLSRFQLYEKKKQKQIQQKKLQKQEKQDRQLKFHPTINKKSLQFIEEMGGHQPIQHRYEKIIQTKNKKIQIHEQLKKQKLQQEYQQFMQQFLKYQKTPNQTRSYQEFYQEMLKWKQKAKRNAEEKKKFFQQKQLQESNNFQPKINQKSQKILMTSDNKDRRLPIYERQIPSEKRFKSKIDEDCTFKPKINKKKVK